MRHPVRFLARRTVIAAVLCTLALALVPTAFGDPWGRDHADAVAIQSLDPAIRAAITARSTVPITALSTVPITAGHGSRAGRRDHPASLAGRQRLRVGRGGIGLVTGIAAMCAVLVCVSLVRHDGRLRHA